MTLGKRIQELRKQRGMSQEALGEALGVSRQAVSKWEGDNGIPELDTLIAMSRLFEVTLGQLLGIEEQTGQSETTANVPDEDQIEAVLRRYAEQAAKKDERPRFFRWGWAAAALILTAAFIVLCAQLGSLRSTVRLLQSELSKLQANVSDTQNNLSGEIRSTIYDVLAEEGNLLSTFDWAVTDFDLNDETATLRLDAALKEYTAGSRLQFRANWRKVDDTEGVTISDWVEGPDFQSELTLPLNCNTVISIRVEDADGGIREQVIQAPIYELHPDNFRLQARNLSAPFAITAKGFGTTTETVKAEQTYVIIESAFPDLFRPEKAELTAYVNDVEVMSELMTVSPSEREEQVFNASIQDTYFDLTLKDGDTLEIVLEVTDSLGRTEQFTDSLSVRDGKIERG